MKDYAKGDWVVHSLYGVGQIIGIEIKSISGEESSYYRVQTDDSTYWMPVDQANTELFRKVCDEEVFENAVGVLQSQPREMSSNHQTRRSRIKRTRLKNTPVALARLIRDLGAYRVAKGKLNQNEKSALESLKKRLTEEWAIATGSRTEKIANKLDVLLKQQTTMKE